MTINVAVIGCGPWGRNHIRVYKGLEDVNLEVVCDLNKNTLKEIETAFKTTTATSCKEILKNDKINAVSICTPASTHYDLSKEFLEAGKSVLVEKPMTLNSEHARNLIDVARDNNVTLMVGQIFRFDPTIKAAKEEHLKGTFGKLYFISLSRMGLARPREDCGAIINYATHDFDIMCDLLDQKYPKEITAITTQSLKREFEDLGIVIARFKDDVVAYSQVSWLSPQKLRDFLIVGEKKSAKIDTMKFELEIFDGGIIQDYKDFGTFALLTKTGKSYKPLIKNVEPLKEELSHFISCIKNKKEPIASGEVGLRTIKMAEAALKSAKEKRTVGIDKNGNSI